jgi:hypothetical protein
VVDEEILPFEKARARSSRKYPRRAGCVLFSFRFDGCSDVSKYASRYGLLTRCASALPRISASSVLPDPTARAWLRILLSETVHFVGHFV